MGRAMRRRLGGGEGGLSWTGRSSVTLSSSDQRFDHYVIYIAACYMRVFAYTMHCS